MKDFSIEKMNLGEIEKISFLIKELHDYLSSYHPMDVWKKTPNKYKKALKKKIQENEGSIFVALKGEDICGYVLGWVIDDKEDYEVHPNIRRYGHIEDIFVSKLYRRQNLGRLLLQGICGDLEKKNISHISLHVLSNNSDAIGFYKKFGFQNYLQSMKISIKND